MGIRRSRAVATSAVLAAVLALVSGCSLLGDPQKDVDAFSEWASAQPMVTAVDAQTESGTLGRYGMNALVSIDNSISNDELLALSESLWEYADGTLGISSPSITGLVGDDWGFAIYENQRDAKTLVALRGDPRIVSAKVNYSAYFPKNDHYFGVQAGVADATHLVEAYDLAVSLGEEDQKGRRTFQSVTSDGLFRISGDVVPERTDKGTTTPAAVNRPTQAILLWQAASNAATVVGADMTAGKYDDESLVLTVASADDIAAVTALSATFPTVKLTVKAQS